MLSGWQVRRVSRFRHLIGMLLSARSRDEMTDRITDELLRRYPTPRALARANRKSVQRILKPIGFYGTKARYVTEAAKSVERSGVPRTLEGLMELPGVGRKVANCILVYAFGQEAIPVDTHVHRVSNRMGWVRTRNPEEPERALVRMVPRRHWPLVNEALVAHGKSVCRPIGTKCSECPVSRWCRQVGVR